VIDLGILPGLRPSKPRGRAAYDETVVGMEIEDCLNIRLVYKGSVRSSLLREWIQTTTGTTVQNYQPLLSMKLYLNKLRARYC
jgi:hypothetical protein